MDDLFIVGSDRKPSPWPRRLALVAVLIVMAVVVITHLSDKWQAPSRHPAVRIVVTVSAGPVQLAGLGSGAAGLLGQADGMTRPANSPAAAGCRLGTTHHSAARHYARRCPITRSYASAAMRAPA
jgi:hypothetical protein